MKEERRIDGNGRDRRVCILQEKDYRQFKHEQVGREFQIVVWLHAAVFKAGDIIVNQRTQDEPSLCGRFELLEEIDSKWLKRDGKRNYYQKFTVKKFRGTLRMKPLGG